MAGAFSIEPDSSIVALPRVRIKGTMTDSAFWRDLHDKFVAFQDRLRASGGATCLTYKQFEVLAKRGASEIARPGTSNLLSVWLEAVWKEDPDFRSLYLAKEVSSLAEFEQNFEIGTLDRMCQDSATFCKKLEDQALQAEFEEKQRNNLGNGSVEIDRSGKLLAAVLGDIRERFLRDATLLRIENRNGIRDRLTHNSDRNGASNRPYEVASAGFAEWIETLGKFTAGHVTTLARMASAHPEWGVADPAEWARIQVAEFVGDEIYPKWCRKCGKVQSGHGDTDHQFSKVMSRIELWWRMVSGEEEDFDLYEYGRPERWSAPVWICKNPEKTENFLRSRHFHFDERLKWVLHDAEGDARIELCLASVNPGSVAPLAPGAPNAEPLIVRAGRAKRYQLIESAISQAPTLEKLIFVRRKGETIAGPNFTHNALLNTYGSLSSALGQVRALVIAKNGKLSTKDLKNKFGRTELGKAADEEDWTTWIEIFAHPRTSSKAAALVFLEKKTGLKRGTIKKRCSIARKARN